MKSLEVGNRPGDMVANLGVMMKRLVDWFLYDRQEPDGWAPLQAVVFLLLMSPFFYMFWMLYWGGK